MVRDKPADDKTFENLKLHFKKWDKDRKLLATSSSAGYHGANHASSTPSSDSQNTLTQLQLQIQDLTSALTTTSTPSNSLPSALQATSATSVSNLTPPLLLLLLTSLLPSSFFRFNLGGPQRAVCI
jgi:hypothetical protein